VLANESFDGFYAYATWFVTGETRPFRGGNFDRVRPLRQLGKDGFGALELALRYDRLDLSNTPILARAGTRAESLTLGLNWYFNPYAKLMFNWVRFDGRNTPLDPIGASTEGDAIATRLHLDFCWQRSRCRCPTAGADRRCRVSRFRWGSRSPGSA